MALLIILSLTIACIITCDQAAGSAASTSPTVLWNRTIGGPAYDAITGLNATSDGGYIIAGNSYNQANAGVRLTKIDAYGSLEWNHTYMFGKITRGGYVAQTTDGGYVVTGQTFAVNNLTPDILVFKTAANGDLLWTRSLGTEYWKFDVLEDKDEGFAVVATADGGCAVAGYESDFDGQKACILKLNASGAVQWTGRYKIDMAGGKSYCSFYTLLQTSDGGYIAGGYASKSSGMIDMYLVKTDANGTAQWSRTFGGPAIEVVDCVAETADGGFVAVGDAGGSLMYLVRTDAGGNLAWDKIFDGTFTNGIGFGKAPGSVFSLPDNSLFVSDMAMLRTNADGDLLERMNPEVTGLTDMPLIVRDADGTFTAAGHSTVVLPDGNKTQGMSLVKMTLEEPPATGTTEALKGAPPGLAWFKTYGGPKDEYGNELSRTSDGGYIITGFVVNVPPFREKDIYLVKTNASGDMEWSRTYKWPDDDQGLSGRQTSDGGYIITGYTYSFGPGDKNVYLIKTDAAGEIQWNTTYGGKEYSEGQSVLQAADGGYIVAGMAEFDDVIGFDAYLLMTDASGNIVREKAILSIDRANCWISSIQSDPAGGYIALGGIRYYDDGYHTFLMGIDDAGNRKWYQEFELSSISAFGQATGGGFVLCGSADSSLIDIIRVDSNGSVLWDRKYNGPNAHGGNVYEAAGGGFVAGGGYLVRTDANGSLIWSQAIDGIATEPYYTNGMTPNGDGAFAMSGTCIIDQGKPGANKDVFLARTLQEVLPTPKPTPTPVPAAPTPVPSPTATPGPQGVFPVSLPIGHDWTLLAVLSMIGTVVLMRKKKG